MFGFGETHHIADSRLGLCPGGRRRGNDQSNEPEYSPHDRTSGGPRRAGREPLPRHPEQRQWKTEEQSTTQRSVGERALDVLEYLISESTKLSRGRDRPADPVVAGKQIALQENGIA